LNDTQRYQYIKMTSPQVWDPYDNDIGLDEDKVIVSTNNESISSDLRIISIIDSNIDPTPCLVTDHRFMQLLESKVPYDYHLLGAINTKRKGAVTASDLAKQWHIGLLVAECTIQQATQRGVRDFTSTGGYRRMKRTAHQLMHRHICSTIYTDTMFSKVKSLKQHTCAQVSVTSFHFFTKVYPMGSKGEAQQTLNKLHHDVGVFHTNVPDNAKELTEGEFCKKAIHAGSQIRPIDAHRHNQNLAESGIRELRQMLGDAHHQSPACPLG
jgi:hypothetical protein